MANKHATATEAHGALDHGHDLSFSERMKDWFLQDGAWWATSFVFHALIMCTLMLIGNKFQPTIHDDAPAFDEAKIDEADKPQELERFEVGETQIDNTELTTDTLTMNEAPAPSALDNTGANEGGGMAISNLNNQPALGGLGGFTITAVGPGGSNRGGGGIGIGVGTGNNPGSGGSGYGFGGRGGGARKAMVGGFGGTKQSERAVAAALNWIARHQSQDGSWSLGNYTKRCKDGTCVGAGTSQGDSAATAMALLPFFAAGQTHESRGPYKATITSGLMWMVKNQSKDGSIFAGTSHKMYTQGLVAIALCEAYALTSDKGLGLAAQNAVNYIQSVQNPEHGGWRYAPNSKDGDTSVLGWCAMALKSAKMAGLQVSDASLLGVNKWLDSCARGKNKGLYAYMPVGETGEPTGPSPSMTAVGLLIRQYMGAKRDEPMIAEGVASLMKSQPGAKGRQLYYWYYATQVMHNIPGPDWDEWNRNMRHTLIDTQVREGCATGSWDPIRPTKELIGEVGGRLTVTCLSTLTLEVYYRYLPLYKTDSETASATSILSGAVGEMDAKKADDGAPADDKPAAQPAAAKKPAAAPPAAEKKPASDKPAAGKPAAGKPAAKGK